MTSLSWMKTYIGDEAALTGHLTAEEFGAYERLRRYYWQHGSPPNDDARLQRITGVEPERWPIVCAAIKSLFDDGWRLDRVDKERTEATDKRERKVTAGREGARKRWGTDSKPNGIPNSKPNGSANGNAMPSANGIPNSHQHQMKNGAYEEEALTRTHTHAREAIPPFRDQADAEAWLLRQGVFPGDLTELTAKWRAGDLQRSDIDRSAA